MTASTNEKFLGDKRKRATFQNDIAKIEVLACVYRDKQTDRQMDIGKFERGVHDVKTKKKRYLIE